MQLHHVKVEQNNRQRLGGRQSGSATGALHSHRRTYITGLSQAVYTGMILTGH